MPTARRKTDLASSLFVGRRFAWLEVTATASGVEIAVGVKLVVRVERGQARRALAAAIGGRRVGAAGTAITAMGGDRRERCCLASRHTRAGHTGIHVRRKTGGIRGRAGNRGKADQEYYNETWGHDRFLQ